MNHVLEIGAGFGRSAQMLVKLIPNLETYAIVDLLEIFTLSSTYLESVLEVPEFSKPRFVHALSLESGQPELSCVDLVINIDSFQEMPQQTIYYYFRKFIDRARFFYSKNAVGKYKPEFVGLHGIDEKQLLDVSSLELSTEVINICKEKEFSLARARHAEQYRPGSDFAIVAQAPLGIFPYYHNVLNAQAGDQ